MEKKVWLTEYEIGVPALDEQHKALFRAAIDFEELNHNKAGRSEIEDALGELVFLAKSHLATESGLMAAYDFPDREKHAKTAHGRLFVDVAKLSQDFHSGARLVDTGTLSSLTNWLTRHIEEDRAFGEFLNSANGTINLVNKIVHSAHEVGASDIHIDTLPEKMNARVRFRKDGALYDQMEIPAESRTAIISRIKVMARMDISEKRKPQDGKLEFSKFGTDKIDLRVATIPTTNGLENVVMRLLSAAQPMPLDQLGLDQEVLARLRELADKPFGLFLVCGPTGAGKTTTLHSILGYLNTKERKIWTAEDPIEISQPGLCQVQVNPKIGWTFAAAMRSLLRADPDIIMVGEMRDAETTHIAIEASLTGHLVFSTLHTNSAPESIVRLLDMGMDRFSFADALLGVLAQRLARRFCDSCKARYVAPAAEVEALLQEYCLRTPLAPAKVMQQWQTDYEVSKKQFALYKAVGCAKCNYSGYFGRVAFHELLTASDSIRKLIQTSATVDELRNAGIAEGMHALKQNGIDKVLQGLTDIHQVRAVCG